jgi:hypothetical protein
MVAQCVDDFKIPDQMKRAGVHDLEKSQKLTIRSSPLPGRLHAMTR